MKIIYTYFPYYNKYQRSKTHNKTILQIKINYSSKLISCKILLLLENVYIYKMIYYRCVFIIIVLNICKKERMTHDEYVFYWSVLIAIADQHYKSMNKKKKTKCVSLVYINLINTQKH